MEKFGFQFNEKGELLFCDKKTKETIKIGKIKGIDEAPKEEISKAKAFYGIE